MEKDKEYCDKMPNKTPIKFSNLDFISCVFFSNRQYNIEKIHKPQYSLCEERSFLSSGIESIEIEINTIIDYIYEKLNKDNTMGKAIKIPAPIYILIGRELKYDSNLLENENFIHIPLTGSKLGKVDIIPDKITGKLAIIDYMNSFFNDSGLATVNDRKKYEKSHLNKYKFKGNIKILVYVPYLSNEYRYISNIKDIINSATFFYNLIMSDVFLSFERTTNIDKEFIKNLKKMNFNQKFIDILVNVLRDASKSKFLLYDDLNNLCFDGGCVSEVGEDLNVLIPSYNKDDDGVNSENAVKFSPFLPNKCLSKTNNFLCNVRYAKDYNIGIDEFVKKYAMADIINGLTAYSMINDMVNKKLISQENINKIDKFKSPLNLIISIINTHIKDGYSNDLNKKDREITVKEILEDGTSIDKKINVKYNHFSKEYSENMIKELSLLNDKYPGVPEIVMSFYIYKDTIKSDKITYMPWGKELISNEYILHIDTRLDVNVDLISFNNKYALKLNKMGYLYVYNIKNKKILYFINYKKQIENSIGFIFNKSEFIVQCINSNNNQASESFSSNIPKLIDDKCKECMDPFTMILDNEGYITIYGNSFMDVTNKDFKNFIDIQKSLVSDKDYDIDNIDDNINQLDYVKKEYVYCSNKGEKCFK